MKSKRYFIILIVLTTAIIIIGLGFNLNGKYWIWSVAGMVLYIWCKDAFTGTNWFEKPKKKKEQQLTSFQQEQMSMPYEEYLATLPGLNQIEKDGYLELTRLCVSESHQPKIVEFLNTLKDFSYDDDYITTLNYVMDYFGRNKIYFIMVFNWKAAIEDFEGDLNSCLKENYNLTIRWPKQENYGERASIAFDDVFEDFDKPLRRNGLQIGFINTHSDQYVVLLHQVVDKQKVEKAVEKIGYQYQQL